MKKILLISVLAALAACTTMPTEVPPEVAAPAPSASEKKAVVDKIVSIAGSSKCAAVYFKERGKNVAGFPKGLALSFAKAVCNPTRTDVVEASKAKTDNAVIDSLAHYDSRFKDLGMKNDKAGVDTLRHVYALMIGLAARESNGRYCCGRDMSADFDSESSAEGGWSQASWGSRLGKKGVLRSQALLDVWERYKTDKSGCFLDVYKEGTKPQFCADNAKNWGGPKTDGYKWQALAKSCPGFATEWTSVLMRVTAGSNGEFGPMRRFEAELKTECDDMLKQVQAVVENNKAACAAL